MTISSLEARGVRFELSSKIKKRTLCFLNHRDGLLKVKIEELSNDEPVFHTSPHEYYENQPEQSDEVDVA